MCSALSGHVLVCKYWAKQCRTFPSSLEEPRRERVPRDRGGRAAARRLPGPAAGGSLRSLFSISLQVIWTGAETPSEEPASGGGPLPATCPQTRSLRAAARLGQGWEPLLGVSSPRLLTTSLVWAEALSSAPAHGLVSFLLRPPRGGPLVRGPQQGAAIAPAAGSAAASLQGEQPCLILAGLTGGASEN